MKDLALHVKAVNRANAEANRIAPILRAIFTPLVGEKIEKADGSLTLKVKKLVPEFPNLHNLRVTRSSSTYSMSWCVYASENDGVGHASHAVTVYVGNLNGSVLESLQSEWVPLRTDYTVDEIQGSYEVAKKLKKEFEVAAGACFPFFSEREIY